MRQTILVILVGEKLPETTMTNRVNSAVSLLKGLASQWGKGRVVGANLPGHSDYFRLKKIKPQQTQAEFGMFPLSCLKTFRWQGILAYSPYSAYEWRVADREEPHKPLYPRFPSVSLFLGDFAGICLPSVCFLICLWIACLPLLSPKWHLYLI